VPISPNFYEQLLRAQILNAQKIQSSHQCLFGNLGSMHVKAVRKMLVKLTRAYIFPVTHGPVFHKACTSFSSNSRV